MEIPRKFAPARSLANFARRARLAKRCGDDVPSIVLIFTVLIFRAHPTGFPIGQQTER